MTLPRLAPLCMIVLVLAAALAVVALRGAGWDKARQGERASATARYAALLIANRRGAEAEPLLARLAASGDRAGRIWAYRAWASILGRERGDFKGFMDKETQALRLDADDPETHLGLVQGEGVLGHEEAALAHLRAAIRCSLRLGPLRLGAPWMLPASTRAVLDRALGDYRGAAQEGEAAIQASRRAGQDARIEVLYAIGDRLQGHDLNGARASWGAMPTAPPSPADLAGGLQAVLAARDRGLAALAAEDWGAAAAALRAIEVQPLAPAARNTLPVMTRPYLAYALARAGDFDAAEAAIARTPADCYLCQRMRGRIAATRGDWRGAEQALQAAIRLGPSLPFAYADEGALRLARGDAASAIPEFALAGGRGPHFADAAELWGEALLRKGDARGAASKFAMAARDAPAWGRVHLFWSRALAATGQAGQAALQLRLAGSLGLTPSEQRLAAGAP